MMRQIGWFTCVVLIVFGCVIFTQKLYSFSQIFEAPPIHVSERKTSIRTVDLAEALQLFYKQGAIFLDVRERRYYDYGHIEKAETMPFENGSKITSKFVDAHSNKEQDIVIYCNGAECGLAFSAARELDNLGFKNISVYLHGWPEWRACRLPMVMSEEMKQSDEM